MEILMILYGFYWICTQIFYLVESILTHLEEKNFWIKGVRGVFELMMSMAEPCENNINIFKYKISPLTLKWEFNASLSATRLR